MPGKRTEVAALSGASAVEGVPPPASVAACVQSTCATDRTGALISSAAAAGPRSKARPARAATIRTGILYGTRRVNGIGRGRTRVPAARLWARQNAIAEASLGHDTTSERSTAYSFARST